MMEILEQVPLITIFIFTISIYVIKTLKNPYNKLPPGPLRLPIIGNLHLLSSKSAVPHRRLAELAAKYGRVMTLQLGEVPTIIVSSADMAREVLKTHDAVFCNRPELMVGKAFYDYKDIAFAPYGEYWRHLRKLSTLELFTTKRVESFRGIRESEAANMINSIAAQVGSVVHLSKIIFVLSYNVMCRATFGKIGKEQEALKEWIESVTEIATGFCPEDLYPSLKFLLRLLSKGKFDKLIKDSDRILDPIIDEHLRTAKQHTEEQEDLIYLLLKYQKHNLNDTSGFSLTPANIKGVILELLSGGSENSSSTLEWTMAEMLKNPRVLQKAQFEVRQVYQGNVTIDETKLHELKYLKLVVTEVLRLHPPVPMLVPRESMQKCKIYSYEIPPKTRVVINAWAIARDPEYWVEPELFKPERFEDDSLDFKGSHFEFIPFGAGRRKCPGMTLGLANIELPIAMLLFHFDWKLPNGVHPEDLNMDESYGLTVRMKNGLFAIPITV